jgi:hypothetical protein
VDDHNRFPTIVREFIFMNDNLSKILSFFSSPVRLYNADFVDQFEIMSSCSANIFSTMIKIPQKASTVVF